jgi:serine/threonine protein phosphatase PrpC
MWRCLLLSKDRAERMTADQTLAGRDEREGSEEENQCFYEGIEKLDEKNLREFGFASSHVHLPLVPEWSDTPKNHFLTHLPPGAPPRARST